MGYNRENYRRIKQRYESKNLRAKQQAEARRDELHAKFPEVAEIDSALSETGLRIMESASRLSGKELDSAIEKLKAENRELTEARARFLVANGYPADYSDVKYECPLCMDTGFVDMKICQCMKNELVLAGYESSGIGHLISSQSFESFDVDYQKDDPRAYDNIKKIFAFCRNYAEDFSKDNHPNLLLIGGTGLGKTHLSTSIAKRTIERGFDVVYDTAQNIFGDFEYERFGRSYGSADSESRTDKYFDCDLLIIDDLGTEMTNQFTVSCLYNIINTRLNHGGATIINTNLGREELRRRYADRITSRLFGEFLPLVFVGGDVREKKLK